MTYQLTPLLTSVAGCSATIIAIIGGFMVRKFIAMSSERHELTARVSVMGEELQQKRLQKEALSRADAKAAAALEEDIRAAECDRITLYDDLVAIDVNNLKESSGKLTVSYKKNKCPLNFTIRYATNKNDCIAAYDEFQADEDAKKEFNFADYSMKVDYNEFCIERLVLQMKEDLNISLKKTASTESNGKEFAKGIARLILAGLR